MAVNNIYHFCPQSATGTAHRLKPECLGGAPLSGSGWAGRFSPSSTEGRAHSAMSCTSSGAFLNSLAMEYLHPVPQGSV